MLLVFWDFSFFFNCYIQNIRYIRNIQWGKILEPTYLIIEQDSNLWCK